MWTCGWHCGLWCVNDVGTLIDSKHCDNFDTTTQTNVVNGHWSLVTGHSVQRLNEGQSAFIQIQTFLIQLFIHDSELLLFVD